MECVMKTKIMVLVGILIIAFAAVVAPVMAATTGSATITGNPPMKMDLTIAGTITGWILDPTASQPLTDSTHVTMTVSSNDRSWVVSAHDALDTTKPAGTVGKMAEWTGSAYLTGASAAFLGSAMQVGATTVNPGFTGATVTLTGAGQAIATGDGSKSAAGVFTTKPITIKQDVTYADPVLTGGDVYQIIVTFTGTTP
jgi:hypothetical protein